MSSLSSPRSRRTKLDSSDGSSSPSSTVESEEEFGLDVPHSAARNGNRNQTTDNSSTVSTPPSDRTPPLTLITFNSYLFPHGLRHSIAFPDKRKRALEIVKNMRRTNENTGASADTNRGKLESAMEQSIASAKSSSSPASTCPLPSSTPSASLLAADICCFQEVLGSIWCSQWKKFFREALTKSANVNPIGSGDGVCEKANNGPLDANDVTLNSPSPDPSSPYTPVLTASSGEYELVFSPRPRLCSGTIIDSGLMIASRYPIIYSAFRSFSTNPFLMKFVDKGFQHAVLDVTSKYVDSSTISPQHGTRRRLLHVINTHLHPHEASYSVTHGEGVRRIQVKQIREYLLATTDDTSIPMEARFDPASSALIMTGDLNTAQLSDQCRAIRDIIDCPNVSIIANQEPTMHSSHPFCNHPPEQTICGDYAVANKQILMDRGEIIHAAAHLSDHYPVKVEFHLRD